MIVLTCFSLIFGAAVGYRHSVFFLIPATILTFIVVIGFCMATGLGSWPAVLTIAAALTCLQIGYLATAALEVALQTRSASTQGEFLRADAPQPRPDG